MRALHLCLLAVKNEHYQGTGPRDERYVHLIGWRRIVILLIELVELCFNQIILFCSSLARLLK